MQPLSIADAHQAARARVTDVGTARAVRLFRAMSVDALDRSWDAIAPALVATVSAAQVAAARQSTGYMARVEAFYGTSTPAEVVPEAFGGVMHDGREVGPAAYGAVTQTKTLIGRGVPRQQAFEVGASFLATIVGAAIQDAGRNSDLTLAAGKRWVRYVRVVSAGACSRCAILAGRDDYRRPFLRHPRCRCTMFPIADERGDREIPKGFFSSPGEYFESLSAAERERVFTKAGAKAIEAGADPAKVVNARRGYFGSAPAGAAPRRLRPVTIGVRADGSPLQVFATDEGTTARGAFGRAEIAATERAAREGRYRRTTTLRLMPEQIMSMAGDNPDRAVELLRRYGYLYPGS
ncbi:MAG: VG15 protein [Coriobacteriia bacterium]